MKKIFNKGKEKIQAIKKRKEDSKEKSSLIDASSSVQEYEELTISSSTSGKATSSELAKEKPIKNLLLIGRTGNGKSTLANVLSQTNVFAESESGVSKTRIVQHQEFLINDQKYLIVDTPGLGDTKLSQEKILDIIAEAVYLARQGVSQVLFVSKGRFDQFEMITYNILREVIFNSEVTNYTTLIRTNFAEFEDEEECQKDLAMMKKESDLQEILSSCQARLIHVDNPPVKEKLRASQRELNQLQRIESEKKLTNHLQSVCSANYQPAKLKTLSESIATDYFDYLTKKEQLARELAKLKTRHSAIESKQTFQLNASVTISDSVIEETKSTAERMNSFGEEDIRIGERIIHLESTKERLQREIAEKEKLIRHKVLKHILNNTDNITNQLGGKVFLNSLADDGQDWTQIHSDFNSWEIKLKWLKEFDYPETSKWAKGLTNVFNPTDLGFCLWLRDDKHYTADTIQKLQYIPDIFALRKEYANLLGKEIDIYQQGLNEILTTTKAESEDWTRLNFQFVTKPLDWTDNTYQTLWQNEGFTYQQAEQYLRQGFEIDDYMFLSWLSEQTIAIPTLSTEEINDWRTNYQQAWIDLDPKFAKEVDQDRTYQQLWEAYGINYAQAVNWLKLGSLSDSGYYCWPWEWLSMGLDLTAAQSWIPAGFQVHAPEQVEQWKQRGFSPREAQAWLQTGLDRDDYGLAAYLRFKNYQPQSVNNLTDLRADYEHWAAQPKQAVAYLALNYPPTHRAAITVLYINKQKLTGGLELTAFPNLTRLDCEDNQLTSLDLSQCAKLEKLYCHSNQLTRLDLSKNSNLTELDLSNNQHLTTRITTYSHLVNLTYLNLNNTPIAGSLAALANCTKLAWLAISQTKLNEGLEYLPASLKWFCCEGTPLAEELEKYGQPDGANFIHLLRTWQVQQKEPAQEEETFIITAQY